ncbi:family 10 glycosylhydrolase [Maribellus comscasis]|uniref:Family 10 glycosylhydrolase n=1 Tax=Maribellus comscasis TaxID=2681766 RepID=A0A6I6JPX6_9BACT|nr:family 10 glycosylhydrolase [Maribellus comscasis]QGY45025.1 family 10 glycosylhydrolase [Maribellus comscasis]
MRYLLFLVTFFLVYTIEAQVYSPKFEFRAVWVATVNNIDWPSKSGLSTEQQKKEITDILNLHQDLGMNAIILQVRPAADAFYPSNLEPWSRYLSGIPGQAPEPFYDPLKFWIDQCHKRGMELHAWLNPYRVAQKADEPLAGNHIAFEHPEWILKYGNKLYFDPGLPQTREFVTSVVKDIVLRYDVDAIHFDDYFYPYPLAEEFPDTTSFKTYNRGFFPENKADWRRENVDIIIEMLNDTIKAVKPWVKFGISPFGVWRNKADDPLGSDTKAGATNYDHLYANIIKWQEKGWIDYCLPQLYWQIGHPLVDFELLANWWKNHAYKRAMYIGHGVYKSDPASTIKEWAMAEELPKQIQTLRKIRGIGGSAFYSSKHFLRDLMGFQDSLKNHLYKTTALVPPMPWLDSIPPQPVVKIKKRGKKIKWEVCDAEDEMNTPARVLIYINEKGTNLDIDDPNSFISILKGDEYQFERLNRKKKKYEVRISLLDRLNNESERSKPVVLKL